MSFIWRPYQQNCFKAIKTKLKEGITRQLIVAATGSGKRSMAINTINWFPRTLFLAHREELIIQAYDEINHYFPMQVGIVKGDAFEIDKSIVVATPQTIHRRLDRIPSDYFQNIIVDEAHHYSSITFRKPLDYFKAKLVTGWSATPTRMDNLPLSDIFEEIVFTYDIQDGIAEGYLCELDAHRITTGVDLSDVHKVAGDFNQKELSVKIDTPTRNAMIVNKYLEYAKDRQFVVYGVDIKHAEHLTLAFRNAGINCETIVSDETITEDRLGINRDYKAGKLQGFSNVNILTEGWDYNDVGCIIMARPTQSKALYMQCIGRGTRLKSPEFASRFSPNCIILDMVDNTRKHELINTWSLSQGVSFDKNIFTTKETKDRIADEILIRKEREVKLHIGRDKRINLFKLPKFKINSSPKMEEPATLKQLSWLQSEGIYIEGNSYTKKQASEYISSLPAPDWMIDKLHRMNYDVSGFVTRGQAEMVFWNERNKSAVIPGTIVSKMSK